MSEVTGEDAIEQALRTPLILESIFKFLPVRSLLCSSQVNKLWYYQARLYIWDHRKCTPYIDPSSPCNGLRELDEILGDISIVPFNSLHIPIGGHPVCSEDGRSPAFSRDNLKLKLKLKHLVISFRNPTNPGLNACPAVIVLFELLRKNSSEIKSLRIEYLPSVLLRALARFQPQLPKLEELDVTRMDETFWEEGGYFLEAVTRASGKLKRILHGGDPKILQILPPHQYHMLTKFNCDDFAQTILNGRTERCMKLAKSGPALTYLDHRICTSTEKSIRSSYEMLQLFLSSSWKSLEMLWIYRICPLYSILTYPPLENLHWLKLHSIVGSDRFMEVIRPIQFGRLFPKMKRIALESREAMNVLPIFSRSPQLEDEKEVELIPGSPFSSVSTERAEITGDVCLISFFLLKQVIPMVTNLCVYPTPFSSHAVPFRQIFRLWPHLRELSISGQAEVELYNCDAEFCGIDQAELEDLWMMEEKELRKLQIVPRRPCPMSMPNLKLIKIGLSLIYDFDALPRQRSQKFLSVVTKCLVLDRLPGLTLKLEIQRGDDHVTPIFDINDEAGSVLAYSFHNYCRHF